MLEVTSSLGIVCVEHEKVFELFQKSLAGRNLYSLILGVVSSSYFYYIALLLQVMYLQIREGGTTLWQAPFSV